MTIKNKSTKKVLRLSVFAFVLMLINVIHVIFNYYHIVDLIWYCDDEYLFFKTLLKCILYLFVPLLTFLGVKKHKIKFVFIGTIFFMLANISMLIFPDVSNYIFKFVFGILGIFTTIFLIISVLSITKQDVNKPIHIISCFINTVIIIFGFITFTVIIPEHFVDFIEDLEYVFVLGLGYGEFNFIYYFSQSTFFILILNVFNIILFNNYESSEVDSKYIENGYTHIAKHILMLFSSLGFYYFGWIYRITKFSKINTVKDEKAKAIEAVILNVFVPFYGIYWYYKISKNVELIFEEKGKKSQNFSTLILILSIFVPFVAYIVLQSKFNEALIYTNEMLINDYVYKEEKNIFESNSTGYISEIKSLKDLLDMGAITQEEFDQKKKELLGL